MNWTELLDEQIRDTYRATYGLLDRVDDDALDWKPPTGRNWMTTGQLLAHITTACGMCCQGFVTGDWGLPEGVDASAMAPEEMLPPAEKMPAVESVAQARDALRADEELARRMVARAGEQDLASRRLEAPWAPGAPDVLGRHLLSMVGHLEHHKAQLFYYLKLQGQDVSTWDLYGMGSPAGSPEGAA